jgi:hypothetical protein
LETIWRRIFNSRRSTRLAAVGEVEEKNRAIHVYGGILLKIRSGFLTLLFGGWSILLGASGCGRAPDLEY